MSAPIRFYIDLTPEARHCPPHWRLSDTRRILLCDDCALPIRHELSMDYASEATHARTQHLLCAKCNRNGFGEPATRTDLTVMDVVGEEPSGDLESDLAEARAEAKRFEAQWELALHEIAELKAERDRLRDALTPDPASPDPASTAHPASSGLFDGRVYKRVIFSRALSEKAYTSAIQLYIAGDIAGAQRVILDDLIAASWHTNEASPTTIGGADVAGGAHA